MNGIKALHKTLLSLFKISLGPFALRHTILNILLLTR